MPCLLKLKRILCKILAQQFSLVGGGENPLCLIILVVSLGGAQMCIWTRLYFNCSALFLHLNQSQAFQDSNSKLTGFV
jgi:hypothetical protein